MSLTRAGVTAAAVLGLVAAGTGPALGADAPKTREGRTLTATPLTGDRVRGAKSVSGRLATSDPALMKATSSASTAVVVKLDYDALAAYTGGVEGYAATSPSVTGRALNPRGAAESRYDAYAAGLEARFAGALRSRVPGATVGRSLRTVYGGLAVRLPANQAKALLALPGVAAVQADVRNHPLTDASANFIGAPTVYSALGDNATAGKGVIVGVLDSGAWPEHPSYADPGTLPAPPPRADGTPRVCNFGDNPLTPANDVFACNRKLISGQPFLATYNALVGGEVYADSARDSDGHGTHTSTTAAGGQVANAPLFGVNRGPLHGIAPGASVAMYKVCGAQGCYSSDSAAAVGQAIADGVKVINFSISGGKNPYSDPVELAFLDAYAAGVFVAASAGNSGPGAATADHASPWVTTVAASTQTRAFQSTVKLTGTDGATATLTGASITGGVAAATPVVLGSAPPYARELCDAPAPPGIFAGKIVVCRRGGNGRVNKGFNVRQGGAVGMLLYNGTETDTETDNHWLPAVHLASGTGLLGFVAAHPGVRASFTAGVKATGRGDVMASFSSRGPLGDWLKPDVTAPGVQILAGMTPTPDTVDTGPPGNLFQAIAGTSMSSPHVAGAAALLFALHPGWTPGQVKSALATTAKRSVVKEDGVTPADPFDMGSGRIDLTVAGNPGVTFDETAATYAALATNPAGREDANLPSINVPTMPGAVTVTRTARNVSGRKLRYTVRTTAPSGATIAVLPSSFELAAGATRTLTVAIAAPGAANGQYFGRVDLVEAGNKLNASLPVAYVKKQGSVTAAQACAPATIPRQAVSTCTVQVQNTALTPATVTAATHLGGGLQVASVTGATRVSSQDVAARATLAGRTPAAPTIAPGPTVAGYLPLDAFGIAPTPVGDEEAVNLDVPAYTFAGQTFTRIGITSDGYAVAGGTTGTADIAFEPQTLPDPARPNAVLAPYWTDLDGTGAPGVYAGTLTDGVSSWVVIEWRLNVFGTNQVKRFETWIGVNGVEDITFDYDPADLPGVPLGQDLTVGAENAEGTGGAQIAGAPTQDLVVTSTPGAPGGSLTYTVGARGVLAGVSDVTTGVVTPAVRGVTTLVDKVTVQ